MSKNKKIKPELAGGFRDYLPEDMIPRQSIIDKIMAVFERFGFVPLDTPGVEKGEILTGGDENFSNQIFQVKKSGSEKDKLALRFDLTIPLARVIAQYPDKIKKPFKRYQIGKAWRGERQQAGRYKEFLQVDADIIGSDSMIADAEIISLVYETMSNLGIENFLIRVNNRKILNGLPKYANFPKEKINPVLRVIDKLDKQGWETVQKELSDKNGLNKKQIEKIKDFLNLKNSSRKKVLSDILKLMKSIPIAEEGIGELEFISRSLGNLGVPEDKWIIDPSVVRGLGYYTGPVFETILTDFPEIGSVFAGGRYDNLVERFSNDSVSAVGISAGVDRLFTAMEKLGKIEKNKLISKVMILNFDKNCIDYIQKIAARLRKEGIPTEIYLDNKKSLKAQVINALETSRVIIIAGESEKKKETVKIKDVVLKKESEINYLKVVGEIKKIIYK